MLTTRKFNVHTLGEVVDFLGEDDIAISIAKTENFFVGQRIDCVSGVLMSGGMPLKISVKCDSCWIILKKNGDNVQC